jgi:hypothetical protein
LFRLEGVSKSYGGVRALEKADLDIYPGRIHGILGENGAGKSTLIKAIAGVVAPDEGRMFLDGREISFASPTAANQAGIVCIFQELSLIPDLSVADNIVISDPPTRFGMIDRARQRQIAEEALARAGAEDIHPLALVKDLGSLVDAVIRCEVDQVEKMIPVMIDVSTPTVRGQRTKLEVPQAINSRLHERFRWPVESVLLISLGVGPAPVAASTSSLGSIMSYPRADLLVFVESKGKVASQPSALPGGGREASQFRGRY